MFESLTHIVLQHYWWIIVSLLGAILVFLLFVQGGQTLIYTLGKTDMEKRLIVNSLGRKWEFTFTTLVTFGGAFFASFPLFYSTSFGGAYWVWMIILFAFIVQAVSYEYRSKPNNFYGAKTYEILLIINGVLAPVLLGTAVASFFTGSEFFVNEMNFSKWEGAARGLELALNPHNLALGLAVLFLSRVLAVLYFMNNIDDNNIFNRSKKQLIVNTIPFLVFFLTFVVWLLFIDGFAYDPITKKVSYESFKYLHNFLQMPIVLILFLIGVVMVLFGIGKSIIRDSTNGIWYSGIGTILTVLALFMLAGFNNTAFYPSTFDLQSSLTIENASSSKYTLKTMAYVSLMVPFVFAYIWYAWKIMNNKKIDANEMKEDIHIY